MGQFPFHFAFEEPLDGTRPEFRAVGLVRDFPKCCIRSLDDIAFACCPFRKIVELEFRNRENLFLGKILEYENLVETVQELGPEKSLEARHHVI